MFPNHPRGTYQFFDHKRRLKIVSRNVKCTDKYFEDLRVDRNQSIKIIPPANCMHDIYDYSNMDVIEILEDESNNNVKIETENNNDNGQ